MAIGTENSDLDAREHQVRIEIQQVKRTSGLRQGRPATATTYRYSRYMVDGQG